MDTPQARPAWKEPMLWLVAAIPAASVVASVALLVAAARSSGNDDMVADRVQRTAQIQTTDIAPDLQARTLALAARLRIDGERILLVPEANAFPRGGVLLLALHHPARAQDDITLALQPAPDGWQATRALPRGHDWNLSLTPDTHAWRLQGRLLRGDDHAELSPALDAR